MSRIAVVPIGFGLTLVLAVPVSSGASARIPGDGGATYRSVTSSWLFPRQTPFDGGRTGAEPRSSPLEAEEREAAWEFSANVRVHPQEGGQHIWPDIGIGPDGRIAVAWMDDHAAGGYHIFYSTSTDDGLTWSQPEQVDTRASGAYSKFVDLEFTPSGIPVAVWEDDRLGGINVFLSKRDPENGGTPWTPNVRVNTTGGPTYGGDFMNPSVAVLDDQRYFVAWTDWREGVFHQVYMRGTSDGGASWGTERRISDGLGYQPVAGDPCLIIDPTSSPGAETLHCVTNDWRGDVPGGRYPNVYFYRSTNGGATWSIGVRVNDVEPYYQQVSSHALVLLGDGALAAGWLNNPDFTQHHFHVSVSTDQGTTWGAGVRVDEPSTGGTGTYSSIAAHGGSVFAAMDIYGTDWDAYFRASSDGGRSWTESMVRMDDDTTGSPAGNSVLAAASGDRIAAAWSDGRPYPSPWKIYSTFGRRQTAGVWGSGDAGRSPQLAAVPNPSSHDRGVHLRLLQGPVGGIGRVEILDAGGRSLRSLEISGSEVVWDGRDRAGRPAPAGTYWVRLQGTGRPFTGRLVRLR